MNCIKQIDDNCIKQIDDNYIKQKFLTRSNKINRFAVRNITNEELHYLLNRYNDSDSINETILRIRDNIEIHPFCKTCGKRLDFKCSNGRVKEYCSSKCANNNIAVKEKRKNTCLERYGVSNGGGSEQALNKIRHTCLEKYWVKYSWQADFVKEKIKQINNEKLGVDYPMQSAVVREKSKQTCLEKYGCEYTGQTEIKKLKCKETFLKHYGVDHNWKNKDVIKKCMLNRFKNKIDINNISSSKEEQLCFEILSKRFKHIIRQHIDELKYPFYCDFYIKDIDAWVEFNGFMTHGGHPFDTNCKEDINKLQYLISMDNLHIEPGNNLYNSTIYTWTVKDPIKRKTAKDNNLNYFEFFTVEDLRNWANNYNNV